MRFGSVCSGIEAASVAWEPLGWNAVWFSEIEPFPCAVLAHHYPDVPNLGDMTMLPDRIVAGDVEAPDVFCGGTPCQAFSVAGKRQSLDDARGNLSLVFCEIANAIDDVRGVAGQQPTIVFWENVPGVLSTKDNAFGCFLGELAGESSAIEPPRGKWTNAGCVYGPKRTVAWRVLDAQYFGVAQRRRRVFVVASARTDIDPAAILFEFDGLRRDTAPRREAGQGTAHATAPCLTSSGRGVERTGDTRGQDSVVAVATFDRQSSGEYGTQPVASTVAARDYKSPSDSVSYGIPGNWIGRAPENGGNAVEPMHDVAPCLTSADRHGVAHPIDCRGVSPTLTSKMQGSSGWAPYNETEHLVPVAQPIVNQPMPINTMIALRHEALGERTGFGIGEPGDPSFTITKGHSHAVAHPIAFNHYRTDASAGELCPTLQVSKGSGVAGAAVAVSLRGREGGATAELGDEVQNCLRASSGGGDKPHVLAPVIGWDNDLNASKEQMGTLLKGGDGGRHEGVMLSTMAVRRLTPVECERLQGFPDDYTLIPWRKKPASDCPDGPRYKALGNSWAVPNVRWIGHRIQLAVEVAA